ncbi:response regulator [Hahella sp. KA22]|uniref:response regulator n=1 Tax=Hahella sp. KA22 TaxID=1628392 RepID=UPI000FDD5759|nr:response regulator [Hahella sp. KA22]AZZ93772.1 response regulator [Hahella sp. KA22]QAY57146.1 response regulator [Hahella sp. KA22]
MTIPILICDDSGVARKQMAKSLPAGWDVEVSFAANGQEAIDLIHQGLGDVLFLDLNMPVMDGYQTLEVISKEELPTVVIVVSGDIQPDARKRVIGLGAFDFIKKPINGDELAAILQKTGLYTESDAPAKAAAPAVDRTASHQGAISMFDAFQEVANVAMGQAADLLARLLDVFVLLPIPRVNLLEISELQMALQATEDNDTYSGVCQGFIGSGIAGEAFLLFHDSSFKDMAKLMRYDGKLNELVELELLMDVSSVLIGACIKGIAEQLDIAFSQGHPVVLGQHVNVGDLLSNNNWRWTKTLAIEICYSIENYNINCDLLLLFTEDSLPVFRDKVAYLI